MSTQLIWEPSERWVRGVRWDTTVVDSRRPRLVWEPGRPVPGYVFPREDVRIDLLRPALAPPEGRHAGATEFYDLVLGPDEVVANAVWAYPDEELSGHLGVEWFGRRVLDHWYEEETEIFVHPRDPHKRVDAMPSSRHVVVEINGQVVADTRRPVLLFETGLPTRYYIPREDVRQDLFTSTTQHTSCPYKGTADYWSWTGGGPHVPHNIVWTYPDPLPAAGPIGGLLAFYNEAVDLIVDGERLERPVTVFSGMLSH